MSGLYGRMDYALPAKRIAEFRTGITAYYRYELVAKLPADRFAQRPDFTAPTF